MIVAIIDSGICNSKSVINMLRWIGAETFLAKNEHDIKIATHFILPGVGSFDAGMTGLDKSNILSSLHEEVINKKKPFLGICLGMQLLLEKSEEGSKSGLGWISGECKRFKFKDSKLKIPHMGWNNVTSRSQSSAYSGLSDSRFYFAHSYYAEVNDENIASTTEYGCKFASGIQKENIMGVQFHPEKSHRFGIKFLTNFLGN
jgi:glutamine amidotransferase